jgi:hypothetical protein
LYKQSIGGGIQKTSSDKLTIIIKGLGCLTTKSLH